MKLGNLPGNYATYICDHVFRMTRPIKLIVFDADGDLSALCGEDDHNWEAEGAKLVGFGHLVDRHSGIQSITLEPSFEAQLSDNDEWRISPMATEED